MKSNADIRKRIAELVSDKRLDKTATVFENAPLALVQAGAEAEIAALRWVLDDMTPMTLDELRQRYAVAQ